MIFFKIKPNNDKKCKGNNNDDKGNDNDNGLMAIMTMMTKMMKMKMD